MIYVADQHWLSMQVVSLPDAFPEAAAACQKLHSEWVVRIEGTLRKRKDPNPRIPTGDVELAVEKLQVWLAIALGITS